MKTQRHSWKSFNSLEDFQKFIDDGNYQCRKDLEKEIPSFFTALLSHGFKSSDIHFPINGRSLVQHKYDKFKTAEDFRQYIKDNNIKTWSEFKNIDSGGLNNKRIELKITKDSLFLKTNLINDGHNSFELIKTLEDVQKFIDNHEDIITITDFCKKYGSVYYRARNILNIDIKKLEFKKSYRKDLSYYDSLEKIREYIKENAIITATDFIKNHCSMYERLKSLGYSMSDLNFSDNRKSEKKQDGVAFILLKIFKNMSMKLAQIGIVIFQIKMASLLK